MEFNSKYSDEELVEILYNNRKLNTALLRDFDNRKYDIMVIMWYDDPYEFEIIGYVYGGEGPIDSGYTNELEALKDNAKVVMNIVRKYTKEGK